LEVEEKLLLVSAFLVSAKIRNDLQYYLSLLQYDPYMPYILRLDFLHIQIRQFPQTLDIDYE